MEADLDENVGKPMSDELLDFIVELRKAVYLHVRMMDSIVMCVVGHDLAKQIRVPHREIPKDIGYVLVTMIPTVGGSLHTLYTLSEKPNLQIQDCYCIARSLVETAINVCYILVGGEEVAQKAIRHAQQKAYRDTARKSEINGEVIEVVRQGVKQPEDIPGMPELLGEFTWNSGREKQGWVDLSVDDRIGAVGTTLCEGIKRQLHLSRFMVYRHASEVIHGSLYGSLFFMGLTEPMAGRNAVFLERIGGQTALMLMAGITCASAVVNTFDRLFGFPSIQKMSTDLFAELGKLPWAAGKPGTEEGK